MRRHLVPLLILVLSVAGLVAAYAFFNTSVASRYVGARYVLSRRSEIRLSLTIRHDVGPLAVETYELSDIEGVSASRYRASGRPTKSIVRTVTVQEPTRETMEADSNVAFIFGKAVQDGIWELTNRPPRGDTRVHYTVHVFQSTGNEHGSRDYTFTDPHYWATTGGHQYHITLDKNKPVPDLLQMTSTVLVEPRYAALVDDFTSFGPASFRAKSEQARRSLGASS